MTDFQNSFTVTLNSLTSTTVKHGNIFVRISDKKLSNVYQLLPANFLNFKGMIEYVMLKRAVLICNR